MKMSGNKRKLHGNPSSSGIKKFFKPVSKTEEKIQVEETGKTVIKNVI